MQNIYFTVYSFLHSKFGKLILSGCRDMHDSFWACDAWSSCGVQSLSYTTSMVCCWNQNFGRTVMGNVACWVDWNGTILPVTWGHNHQCLWLSHLCLSLALVKIQHHHWEYMKKYQDGTLTPEDIQHIILVLTTYDMPLLLNYSLAFTLFKTYVIVRHQQDCICLEIQGLAFLVPLVISSLLVSHTRANELIWF